MSPWWWLLLPAAYLLGSVSFAWMAGRIRGIDLRQHGSGNLGATNAGRVLGAPWFYVVFVADVAKGLAPVLVARHVASVGDGSPWFDVAVALAAVLGHVFTCFHGFRGGKAVATTLGVLIGLLWQVAALTLGVWLVVWACGWTVYRRKATEAVGPASVAAAALAPLWYVLTDTAPLALAHLPLLVLVVVLALVVLWRHRSNIGAMFRRTPTQQMQRLPPP
jgi:glycerol-3-phosphate acyltransferase PlsY